MLRSETLFGKRDNQPNSPLNTASGIVPGGSAGGFSKSMAASGNTGTTGSTDNVATTTEGGSKLIVGQNIKLKGELADCDTLVVQGRVEATMEARLIQIAESGAFKGSAEVDFAEIHGEFDGELTVRQKLVIYSTGKVSGKVRYGKVVIEEGGQLSGDIQVVASGAAKPLSVAKVG
ncbi:MAG TPA: polymer-forming cytoskeletal protein [Noviherbaspirillum sp.]|jgi:cytoskeletal protein CcmA (bactofilin family)|uniref:bactofilin family protein n=1 Tax=Noviherbaspirillum sp. TaxID=1926288 RepID=UPI002F93D84C